MYYKKDTTAKTYAMCVAHVSAARVHAIEVCAQQECARASAQDLEEYCQKQRSYKEAIARVEMYDKIIDLIDANEFDDFGDLARAVSDANRFPDIVLTNVKYLISKKE